MFSIRASKRRDGFTLDVAIEVAAPGVIALFGRSGCGKTTLVNILAGLLDADDARIEIDGIVLEDTRARARVPIEHQMDRRLLDRTIEIAAASKAFGTRNLRAALDSSPLWGAWKTLTICWGMPCERLWA